MRPAVEVRGWGWRYSGRSAWAARDISFTLAEGERVLLLGPSGAGKSTLLAGLAGVLGDEDEGEEAGALRVGGKHPTRMRGAIGLVMQDPDAQVISQRVGDDVAFGCENLGMAREDIWSAVGAGLDAVNLRLPLEHPTSALSGGQKQRLAIAGALAMQSGSGEGTRLLCLDEPTANLDPAGVERVREAVTNVVADRRTTLVIVEHRIEVWSGLVDRVIVLAAGGGVLADGSPAEVFAARGPELAAAGAWVPGIAPDVQPRSNRPASGPPILTGHRLTIGYRAGQPVQAGLEVAIPSGLSTVVVGPNGAGKTTLALTLAGLLAPLSGRVEATEALRPGHTGFLTRAMRRRFDPASPATWASRDLLTRLGVVFQNPEHQFVETSVRAELGVGLRALGRPRSEITGEVDALLERLHLTGVADANPFTLSGGEKRRLSVGTVLATGPSLIVLDEPTFGQDRTTWTDLVELVQAILDEGRTIVSVTHDDSYLQVLGENLLPLEPADREAA
ncbi:ABC transporter ATP-binding protein [Propionibacterium australiense]|uniref:ABC transporter n=1 Tax=Propionibacterium australiense TaxID=119981 RepID=A0A383S7I3_9ACTN|nr:ABC transporter ATP-binding protein [Propionibacterium australiense]RLP09735.1 ATP-binding cassette domain-containing protein [Propionibacterium australiense]RLP10208.1 ATP-binding cassette domain-containing protein [Propionibacterium australiense]SYZ33206.1 ABC transporter [Propionibacterium australiense]VEH89326.1 Putative HMP/thiamine import ATP-binding protein YkoD [Propionibacterium australiense]